MKTVKIVWKSAKNGRYWLGISYESGDFFATTPLECTSEEAHNKYDVGDEIEVPTECL